jgi:hypothetical protein
MKRAQSLPATTALCGLIATLLFVATPPVPAGAFAVYS